jgi:hypothetical protein
VSRPGCSGETHSPLRLSAAALVLANLVPLAGVLVWDWSVSSLLILYWFENVVIGVINVARMVTLSPTPGALVSALGSGDVRRKAVLSHVLGALNRPALAHALKLFVVPFFIVHYFGFCAGHGVFVFAMFGDEDRYYTASDGSDLLAVFSRPIEIFSTPLGTAAAVLALSHLFSFVQNYLIGGEYRRLDLRRLMFMPYGRIIVLHVTILAGGFATMLLGGSVWPVAVLVAMKIVVDLKMHLAEHRKAA